MDDLIHRFEGLGSGRYDDEGIGGMGELNGATASAAVSGDNLYEPYSSGVVVESSETEDEHHDNSLKSRRENIMQFFRKEANGAALLTRLYVEPGVDWTDYVFNISVNEALRTCGKNAESIIEKELGQVLTKKLWTPVNVKLLSYEEKGRIIKSSIFLKEKFLASG